MDEQVMKRLVASMKCRSCGQTYDPATVEVLEQSEEMWFLRVYCPSCHVSATVAAIIRNEQEARFRDAAAISEADVRDMHEFLEDFHGDTARLFQQNGDGA